MTLPEDVDTWVRLLTLFPIPACSIVGTALTVTKWLQLRRWRIAGEGLIALVTGLEGGATTGPALAAARVDDSIAARLVEYGLALGNASRWRIAEHVEHAGRQLTAPDRGGLDAVALIATLRPLRVSLPRAVTGEPTVEDLSVVRVQIDADGQIYLGGRVQPLDTVRTRPAAIADCDRARVTIAADRAASHGSVVQVLDLVRQTGIVRVGIQTFTEAGRSNSR